MIIQKMIEADGIIFQSPVYVNIISSQMKIFMERVSYLSHRPQFYGKPAIVMAVCGGFGADQANEYMTGIFSSFGFNIAAHPELRVAKKSETESSFNHQQTTQAVDTLISTIEAGILPKPTTTQVVMFYIYKMLSELQKEYYEADYEFYKDMDEFPFGDVSPLKKMFAKRIATSSVKDMMKNR